MKLNAERHGPITLFLILLLALGLRIYHLDYLCLWYDEGFTRFYAASPLSYLWTTGFQTETNPPGYYTVLHLWMSIFGTSEFALRFPSVLASVAVVALVYALGKELESRTAGLIAALLMAVAPSEIWYAQETRTYALLQVGLGVALLGMVRYLSSSRSWRSLVVYALGAIGAIYCHDTGFIFIAACNVAVITAAVGGGAIISRYDLIRWFSANVVVGLAAFPLLMVALHQSHAATLKWIPPLTPFSFLALLGETVGGPASTRVYLHIHSLSYLLLLVMVIALWRLGKLDRRSMTALVLVPVYFLLLALLIHLHSPILIPRIVAWLWIPLSLLLAHVLIHAGRMRLVMLALTGLVLAVGLSAQLFASPSLKENWRVLARGNQAIFSQADVVAIGSNTSVGNVIYYMPGVLPRLSYWNPEPLTYPPNFSQTFVYDEFKIPGLSTDNLLDAIRSGKHACLIVSNLRQVSLALSPGLLPPPTYEFDDSYPNVYRFHVMAWNYGEGHSDN